VRRTRWGIILTALTLTIGLMTTAPAHAATGQSHFVLYSGAAAAGSVQAVTGATAVGVFNEIPGTCQWTLTSTTFTCTGLANLGCAIYSSTAQVGGRLYSGACFGGSGWGAFSLFVATVSTPPSGVIGAAAAVGWGSTAG
jgi:hypothetical protein